MSIKSSINQSINNESLITYMPLTERIQYHIVVLTYKARNYMIPPPLPQYLTLKFSTVAGYHGHATHSAQSSDPQPNLELYRKRFNYRGAVVWEQHSSKH